MASKDYCQYLRQLIQENKIEKVIQDLSKLLQNSPKLDEAILQSFRWNDLKKQIRLGQLSQEELSVNKNQIVKAVLELLREIEEQKTDPLIEKEVTRHAQNISGKNILVGNTIQADGNITIGDQQTITESKTSKNLRLFLFLFVPLLAIATGVLYFKYQLSQQPVTFTVFLDNKTPNAYLPFEEGKVILRYNGKVETQLSNTAAIFRAIPANNRNKKVDLKFTAPGFQTIDTSILLENESLNLPIKRDDSYRKMYGKIEDESGNPIENGIVRLNDVNLETRTDAQGNFSLNIPFDKQRKQQRLEVSKAGYQPFDRTEPVNKDRAIRIQLIKN